MALSKYTWGNAGADVDVLYGPQAAAGRSSDGYPQPQFRPGTVVTGDGSGEWTFCTLVLAGTTNLLNGQAYTIDKNFTATLLSTANSVRGTSVGFGCVQQASVAAGTYYLWLQTNGHAPTLYTGSASALAETTATAGTVNYNNTSTATTKRIVGVYVLPISTFTADNTNGSTRLTNVSSLNDVSIGQTLAGTGVGASAKVVGYGVDRNQNYIDVDVASTATNTGQTITPSGVYTANVTRPYVDLTNP